MAAICGILGRCQPQVVRAMARAMAHRGEARHVHKGDTHAIASSAPLKGVPCVLDGAPRDPADISLGPKAFLAHCGAEQSPAGLGMRGPFAATVCVDAARARWWLLRDFLGRKPLYYYHGPDFLLFASELKGLLASGRVTKQLNLQSIDRYLTLRCVPGPETIIQGVFRVKPGHVVEYQPGQLRETPFASLEDRVVELPRDTAAAQLRELLEGSVARFRGEGLLWSGGIDCAALGALSPHVRPVNVVLERAWQDEAKLAKESARRLNMALESCTGRHMTEKAFFRAVHALDEPLADASVFPLWLVAEEAARHATVFMSGHGADEILGGYPRYHLLGKTRGAQALVPVSLLSGILPALPPNAFVRRWSHYLASIRDNLEAYLSLVAVFDHEERNALYTDAMKAVVHGQGGSIAFMRAHFTQDELIRNLLSLEVNIGLPDLLLTKCDRIAAAHGMTWELPYLDDDLVSFAVTLSPATKFGVRSKRLLRLAMKGVLPGRIRLRARRDFRIPQGGRVVQLIENVRRQTITPERVDATGLFKWSYVEQVLRSATHNVYRRRQFWALLMFFAWYREVMES